MEIFYFYPPRQELEYFFEQNHHNLDHFDHDHHQQQQHEDFQDFVRKIAKTSGAKAITLNLHNLHANSESRGNKT